MPRPILPSTPAGLTLMLVGLGLVGAGCERAEVVPRSTGPATQSLASAPMPLRQGPFERHLTLTGEIDTVAAVELTVGQTPGNNINDPADDRSLRKPDIQDFNVQVRLNMKPLTGQQLDFYVDILNALALRTPTSIGQEDGRDFGVIRDRMDPFRIRLGLNYKY